ncbi:Probable tRNA (adenine(37)-N6)-methyltransferase [Chlamydiales bacterium SCGC AG-110-P3]|nr:Probable tRNA (adenine(37)-N6)-methyltransferase [Chlamydiales bacterium SCGC AG-110-P3]
MTELDSSSLILSPIGYFHTASGERYTASRQPGIGGSTSGVVELLPHRNFEQALSDLDGFDRVWLLFQFDRNRSWKPKVMPPRGGVKRGVFATRSPHRPNPIGMSCVSLNSIEGRKVFVGGHDLLDGTPIFDIKPYVSYADSFSGTRQGWLDALDETSEYAIEWTSHAQERVEYLRDSWGIDLERGVSCRLQQSPYPYPNARIRAIADGFYELAYQSWRLQYRVCDQRAIVSIERVETGYDKETLAGDVDKWGDLEVHRGFVGCFSVAKPDVAGSVL